MFQEAIKRHEMAEIFFGNSILFTQSVDTAYKKYTNKWIWLL